MENEEYTPEIEPKRGVWTTVTPFSKYLSLFLLVTLPFIGGWIGYTYAPEKVVEVEMVVVQEVSKTVPSNIAEGTSRVGDLEEEMEEWDVYSETLLGYKVSYLSGHALHEVTIDTFQGKEVCTGSLPESIIVSDEVSQSDDVFLIFNVAIDDPNDICVSGHYTGLLKGKVLTGSKFVTVNDQQVLVRDYIDDLPEPETLKDIVGEYDSSQQYIAYKFSTYQFKRDGKFFTLSISTSGENRKEIDKIFEKFVSSFNFIESE